MAHLFLVKHALPEIQPDVPAKHWLLGEKGRVQSLLMAERLRLHHPKVVVTSDEPKAAETGQIVAKALGVLCYSAPGLHENDRTGVPYFDVLADLEASIKTFFENPDKRVFGGERANEAQRRFISAVKGILELYPEQDVVIVAHGTVNTLFVDAFNAVAPFNLWRAWPLAGFAVLARPEFGLLESPHL